MNEPIVVKYVLEHHDVDVHEFTPIHITWKANASNTANRAHAVLLSQGFDVGQPWFSQQDNSWLIRANF